MFNDLMKKPYVKPVTETEESNITVSIDIGSTQTRSYLRDDNGYESGVLTVDTPYITVHRKLEDVKTQNIIDANLEAEISSGTISTHIIKGDMRTLYNKSSRNLVSSCSKLDQDGSYISILFMLGLNALLYEMKTNQVYNVHKVRLMLALPSEDIGSDSRKEKVDSMLKGVFEVKFPRFNRSVNIELNEINVYSEVSAAAIDYIMGSVNGTYTNTVLTGNSNCVFLDCGGRNKSAILYRNGKLATESSVSLPGGGENYIRNISKIVQNTYGINKPDNKSICESLTTATLRNGNTEIDLIETMHEAKELLADQLMDTIFELLDFNGIQLQDISYIICSGRTMLPSVRKDTTVSPSVVVELESIVHSMSPNTQCVRTENIDAVIKGLDYMTFKK